MGDDQQLSYEDLLRPIKDVLLKNWRMSLAPVLDEFLLHLHQEEVVTNFPQAAMLLQNSTTLYCKRVDVVFHSMEELSEGMTNLFELLYNKVVQRNPLARNEAPGPTPAKKRRLLKALEDDDLELLGFVNSDHNIDLHVRKSHIDPPLKIVVLNKEAKSLRKPEANIPVLGSVGAFMGYKDDFRLNGKTWSDGTVNDDYIYRNDNIKYWRSLDDETNGHCVDDCDEDNRIDDTDLPNEPNNGFPEPVPIEDPALLIKDVKIRLSKIEDCDPVSFNFNYCIKILKRKRVFQLPKELIQQAEEVQERQAKLQKRRDKRAAKLLNGSAVQENGVDHTIDEGNEHCAAEGPAEDVISFSNKYVDAMRKFKRQRMENALRATELAKRVSEWHEAIMPRIAESESRSKFNVHEYADKIFDKFPDECPSRKSFRELMEDEPKKEVGRFFLATLLLANTYNLTIETMGAPPTADMELTLLNKIRHHEAMDEQLGNLC